MRDRWYSNIVLPKFNSIYSKPSKVGRRRPVKKKGRSERKWGKEKDRFIDFELCILYSEKGNQCQIKEKGRKVLVLWSTLLFSILLDRV